MSEILSRQELYELVWAEPVRTVAQRFGMSDVAYKKYCVRAGVPVPERGYWAKLAAGKAVTKIPLPPRAPGASDKVQIGRTSYGWSGWSPESELAKPLPERPEFPEPLEVVRARASRRLGKVKYIRDLSSPYGGLRKTLTDEAKRLEQFRTQAYVWDKPLFESGFEKRRLRFLSSLGLGLLRAGAHLDVRGKEARELTVVVGDTTVKLQLDHPSAKPNRHGEWKTREGSADALKLLIGPETERAPGYQAAWQDDVEKLESHLTEIALAIIVAGEAEYRAGAQRAYEWRLKHRAELEQEVERRRQEAERLAEQRRIAEERARREHLLSQAQAWRTAEDIRGFVATVLKSPPRGQTAEAVEAWANWALAEAAALDPITSGSLSPRTGEEAP